MASLGDNITAVSVHGTFDDCQRLVKQAFADDDLRRHVWLTPANSINLGRLLPQVFYYFVLAQLAQPPVVAVPSGNFGNLTAGLIAQRLGLRVARFIAGTNVNDAVPAFLRTGHYQPRESLRTVANAMDVGAPSNFERMVALYGHDLEALRRALTGAAYRDDQIVQAMTDVHRQYGYVLDPHAAVGWLAISEELVSSGPEAIGVFLATAHPAKFPDIVERAIGEPVALPPALAEAIRRPRHSTPMPAQYRALSELLRTHVVR